MGDLRDILFCKLRPYCGLKCLTACVKANHTKAPATTPNPPNTAAHAAGNLESGVGSPQWGVTDRAGGPGESLNSPQPTLARTIAEREVREKPAEGSLSQTHERASRESAGERIIARARGGEPRRTGANKR